VKTLFLLGHMRSYSSVLSHILGSHPQISGYCETHTKYRTWVDLWKLRWRVRKLTGEALRSGRVLDALDVTRPSLEDVYLELTAPPGEEGGE
jgi:hypothetical protein